MPKWKFRMKGLKPTPSRASRRSRTKLPAGSHSPSAYLKQIRALHQRGKLEKAEVVAIAAIKEFPESPEIWHEYAMVAHASGDLPEAAHRWEKLFSLFPDAVRALTMGAMALREAGRIPEAKSLAENGLAA